MPSRTNKTWLIPLLIQTWESTETQASYGPLEDEAAFEVWLAQQLVGRGYHSGLPADLLHQLDGTYVDAPFRDFLTMNAEAHRMQLGAAVLRRTGVSVDVRTDGMLILAAMAWCLDRPELADQAYAEIDAEEDDEGSADARSRSRSDLAAKLGQRVSETAVAASDPLLGHPFHEILLYHEAQLFGRVMWQIAQARSEPGGRLDPADLLRPQGLARAAQLQSISACIGLLMADSEFDTDQRRLVQALMSATRLSETETAMLRQEMDTPDTPESLAAEIQDPSLRHFILRLLLLTIHVNGDYAPEERAWFDDLAHRFGADEDALQAYEIEALQAYEHHARLFGELSFTRVASRLRQRLTENLELMVTKHASALRAEISDTSDLGQLVLKSQSGELSDDEKAQMKRQMADVFRAIPALAIFVAPGGTLLLPLAVKHLPFQIVPTNFDKRDEL